MFLHIGQVLQVAARNEIDIRVGERTPGRADQQRTSLQETLAAHIEVRDIRLYQPVNLAVGDIQALFVERHIRREGEDIQKEDGRAVDGGVQRQARQRVQINGRARDQRRSDDDARENAEQQLPVGCETLEYKPKSGK